MSALLVLLLIVSSVALSIGLSRLAVGEMFRLVSNPAFRPPSHGTETPSVNACT